MNELPRTPTALADWARHDRAAARDAARSGEIWRSLLAESRLTVSSGAPAAGDRSDWLDASRSGAEQARIDLCEQGFARWPGLVRADRSAGLAAGVSTLCAHGWDAAFIALCDEAWQLAFHLATTMGAVVDPAVMFRRELFAFCVDPTLSAGRARGVPAHRDRPDSGYSRVRGLAVPRHCTCWLALTPATLANGCMRVVPCRADDDAALAEPPSETSRGLALEADAGTLLAWSGQAIHWGGRHDRSAGARIAMAFSMTHPEVPSIGGFAAVRHDTLPDLAERRALVATLLPWLDPPAPGSAVDVVLDLLRGET